MEETGDTEQSRHGSYAVAARSQPPFREYVGAGLLIGLVGVMVRMVNGLRISRQIIAEREADVGPFDLNRLGEFLDLSPTLDDTAGWAYFQEIALGAIGLVWALVAMATLYSRPKVMLAVVVAGAAALVAMGVFYSNTIEAISYITE